MIKKKNKGITLVALVITIIVLLVLAGITIAQLKENGLLYKATRAKDESEKQVATEKMNLKITEAEMSSWEKEKRMPTLQELANEFCKNEDDEFEYVLTTSKKTSSKLENIIVADSIFTKFKEYPYEFEIDSSLKLASIDGVKISNDNNEKNNETTDKQSKIINDFKVKVSLENIKAKIEIDGKISTVDGSNVVGYIILVNGEATEVNKTLPYVVKLDGGKTFKIEVIAIDKEANLKRSSNSILVTTPSVIETVLDYPILTTDGMVNVKYTKPDDGNFLAYGLNKIKQCTASDALGTEAFDGIETTCSKVSEGKTTFFIQTDVKIWNVVCASKDNPYFTFPGWGYWRVNDWKNIGDDWWYVQDYGKNTEVGANRKCITTYDIYELKYDTSHQE